MPPQARSRYLFCEGRVNAAGALFLTDRVPFRFRELPDSRVHTVIEGHTLRTIANTFFEGIPRPSELWWVIADFQPEPIVDPTIRLTPNRRLIIPSVRTVLEKIFNESRRDETPE